MDSARSTARNRPSSARRTSNSPHWGSKTTVTRKSLSSSKNWSMWPTETMNNSTTSTRSSFIRIMYPVVTTLSRFLCWGKKGQRITCSLKGQRQTSRSAPTDIFTLLSSMGRNSEDCRLRTMKFKVHARPSGKDQKVNPGKPFPPC